MDLKSFYKKIDVDSIKNKLPPLKIPKIKSRKIFKSSREDLAQQQPSPVEPIGIASPITPQSLPVHSTFIDRTPTRISTVSSLMNINYGFKDKHESNLSPSYKTASNFEEENCPDEFDTREPVTGNSVSRFGDKCKKTYKDFSEFKIKNIFAKKTVVKRTEIEVDIYARQYERDIYLEEQEMMHLEEEEYKFEFKEARRRLSRSSGSISPPDSLRSGVPSPIRSELGRLQQNETPPLLVKRRNAISHTEDLKQKLHRSMSSDSNDEPPRKPNKSSLWGLNENNPAESGEEQVQVHRTIDSRLSKFKKSMKEGISSGMKGSVSADSGDEQSRIGISMARFKKPPKEGTTDGSKHVPAESGDEQPSTAYKAGTSRMARFKKSMKEGIAEGFSDKQVGAESGDDQPSTAPKAGPSRMARFKKSMKEGISEGFSDKHLPAESGDEKTSPIQKAAGTSKVARFKKSMREGISEGFSGRHMPAESGDEQSSSANKAAGPSKMARFKKSMREGISEGFSDKHIGAESGDDQPSSAAKAGPSRMARFKKSMKEGISEGFSEKHNPPTESGDEQPQKGVSRMAKLKKSMKEGISEGFSAADKNIPAKTSRKSKEDISKPIPTVSSTHSMESALSLDDDDEIPRVLPYDDEQPSMAHKIGPSRTTRIKAPKKVEISDRNLPSAESGDEQPKANISRMSKFKQSMKDGMSHEFDQSNWNLKGIRNRFTTEDTDQKPKKNHQSQESLDDHSSDHEKKTWKLSNIHLRRTEPSERNNEQAVSSPEGKFAGIKMSINRLKSRKPQRQTSDDSETEQQQQESSPKQNMSGQLKAGLRRLRMGDRSLTFDEEDETKTAKEPTGGNAATNRLRNWKKSIKMKRPSEVSTEDINEEPPPLPASSPPGRSSTLIRKLNHIRSRKVASEDGEDSGNDQQKQRSSNMEKLEQARTKALRKVNAQVQKMKNFHGKSRDSPSEGSPEKEPTKTTKSRRGAKDNAPKPLTTALSSHSLESALSLDDDDEEIPRALPEAKVLRNTNIAEPRPKPKRPKPSLIAMKSHSMQSSLSLDDNDEEDDTLRVYLHQDNSYQYEPTLTVAVSRPAPPIPTAHIKEILPKAKYQAPKNEWIPNKNAISSFLEMTPSPESSQHQLDVSRGHLRKRSMDSNDSDSWIPENFRTKSCSSSSIAGLNKISENSEPWKVHSVFSEEKLYKAKSIDIFANRDGGAFRDFDDEMRNVPVRRIIADSAESLNKSYGGGESTDDDDDYDNSSRITRVKHESPMKNTKVAIETIRSGNLYESTDSNKAYRGSPVPNKKAAQIGNSQESLDANYDENDEVSSDEDDDEEDDDETPAMAPSPPPSFSPPPPPLPLRKPPRVVPERNDSMVRLAHPLVKQGSLRRHFSEEIEPSDLGKVNKLITRFEKNPTYENVPRIQLIPSDDDDGSLEVEEQKATKTKQNDAKKVSIQYSSNSDISTNFDNEDKNRTPTRESAGFGKKRNPSRSGSYDEEGNHFEQKKITRSSSKRRPAPIPKQTVKLDDTRNNNNENIKNDILRTKREKPRSPSPDFNENLDNVSIQSPNSIYGSPIGSICLSERISTSSIYGSPVGGGGGADYLTKSSEQLRSNRRLSNRSSLRDDDTFYSFESDEENNFYSLGDSSDMRYSIEI